MAILSFGAIWRSLLRLQCVSMLLSMALSTPPEDPVKCAYGYTNCTVTNSYGTFPDRSTCRASNVAYPTSESELITVVAAASKAKRKMRVVTRFSHSIPKLACTDGNDGLLISTKFLNRTLSADAAGMTLTVESGVTLRQLISEAAKAGLALPNAPYWWGLTVGGMMGTGAHGSSLWGKGSAVHDYVSEIRIVSPASAADGFVKVRVLDESNPNEFNAAKVSLGVLGVISQVTFKLQSMFKRSITYIMKNDLDFGDEAIIFGEKHEFADFTWYPSQGKVAYRTDGRVPSNTSGNGVYDYLKFRPKSSVDLANSRSTKEQLESQRDVNGICSAAKVASSKSFRISYGLTNNGTKFTGYPVVGDQDRLMSSGTCLDSLENEYCPWDARVKGQFYYETSFSIPFTSVKDFINDIKALVEIDPKSLCRVNSIVIRYVTSSPAYLGKDAKALEFDLVYYRSRDPLTLRMFEDFLEEIEQMALFKYKALPHWGKNRNTAFHKVIEKYKKAAKFLKVKEQFDPMGLLSSEWTDQILGLKGNVTIVKEGCALEGLCICSEDVHCAPSKGYFCRPGKMYKEARVCAPSNN